MFGLLADAGAGVPSLASSWSFEPYQIVPTAIVGVLYARRARALRERGTPVPLWRQWLFWTGIALVLVALVSPVDAYGEDSFFFVHMLQHVILGELAPLCFVAGLTGPILRPVLALRFVDRLRILRPPPVALPSWLPSLYVWPIPFLYEAALEHPVVHALEHVCFF